MATTTTSAHQNELKKIISGIRNLPTPPIVFEQIQKVINEPDTSVNDVASILSEDPAMSVKVLKLTNSVFYGLQREVDSVNHAVMIIGLEAVKNLVLSASVLNMFKADDSNREYHENFWRHSLSTALVTRLIARRYEDGKVFNPDPAFSSGLIHDIGKMIISCFLVKEYEEISSQLEKNPELTEVEAEEAILGYNHAQLGRELIIHWKLPARMADAIGFHHKPMVPNESENFAYLINIANYIAHVGSTRSADVSEEESLAKFKIEPAVLDFFGMTKEDVEGYKAGLMEEYMKAETFMRIAGIN